MFKPKNEEPYGEMNPKWLKFFQRIFFPCCFGRNCLLRNQGYMSEAGASLVDRMLGLNIVPPTFVVKLASPAFNYTRAVRYQLRKMAQRTLHPHDPAPRLPEKIGSLQLFVSGCRDAVHYLTEFEREPLPAPLAKSFQLQFERLVILDYIIRNTGTRGSGRQSQPWAVRVTAASWRLRRWFVDRGNDNWLIRYAVPDATASRTDPRLAETNASTRAIRGSITENTLSQGQESIERASGVASVSQTRVASDGAGDDDAGDESQWEVVSEPVLSIAAIDNGLAFPIKHPDSWRTFPYGWSWLPQARLPFSQETIDAYLPKLSSNSFVESLIGQLRALFALDEGFDDSMFERQAAMLRGQIYNIVGIMRERKSPLDLVKLPAVVISRSRDAHLERGASSPRTAFTAGSASG